MKWYVNSNNPCEYFKVASGGWIGRKEQRLEPNTRYMCCGCMGGREPQWIIHNGGWHACIHASMHITKELIQHEHVAEEDYEILSKVIDSNWERYIK